MRIETKEDMVATTIIAIETIATTATIVTIVTTATSLGKMARDAIMVAETTRARMAKDSKDAMISPKDPLKRKSTTILIIVNFTARTIHFSWMSSSKSKHPSSLKSYFSLRTRHR
jgi:hypothetical protein